VISQQHLPSTVLKLSACWSSLVCLCFAITPSTCSIYQLNRIKPRVNHFDLLGVLCLSFIEYIHGHFFYILKM